MAEIPHQHARDLLQSAADWKIGPKKRAALDAHLAVCKECSAYAASLTTLEAGLRDTLHARLDFQRPNLDLDRISNPAPIKILSGIIANFSRSTGRVAIVTALFLGYLILASHLGVQLPISRGSTPTTLPTPSETTLITSTSPIRPSPTPFTLAGQNSQACATTIYIVPQTEDIKTIAFHLGTSENAILEYNLLNSRIVSAGMRLHIPQCVSTPTRTENFSGNSYTITPRIGTIFIDQPE